MELAHDAQFNTLRMYCRRSAGVIKGRVGRNPFDPGDVQPVEQLFDDTFRVEEVGLRGGAGAVGSKERARRRGPLIMPASRRGSIGSKSSLGTRSHAFIRGYLSRSLHIASRLASISPISGCQVDLP